MPTRFLRQFSLIQVEQLSHGFAACLFPLFSLSLSLCLSLNPFPRRDAGNGRHRRYRGFHDNVMQLRHGIIASEMARVKSKKRTRRREIHVHSVNEAITASALGARTRIRVVPSLSNHERVHAWRACVR